LMSPGLVTEESGESDHRWVADACDGIAWAIKKEGEDDRRMHKAQIEQAQQREEWPRWTCQSRQRTRRKIIIKFIRSFIHARYFYSASSSPLLLRGAPDCSIDTLLELTRRSATGKCEWSTCLRYLRGG